MLARFFTSPTELWSLIGSPAAPQIIDTRRRDVHDAATGILPTAIWRDAGQVFDWLPALERARPVIVACKAGHERSQAAAAVLRERGHDACVLAGGYAAWTDAGLPLVTKATLDRFAPARPSLWVTRRRPKIDRLACPWLIRRFIDADARILFVDPPEVSAVARDSGAIPFDIEGVEISHDGQRCSFDTLLKLFGMNRSRLSPASR